MKIETTWIRPICLLQWCLCILLFGFNSGTAQQASDYAVQISVELDEAAPAIVLHWLAVASNSYFIHRKAQTANTWGAPLATLPGTAVAYRDTSVMPGIAYEYRVTRTATGLNGYGYVWAGIDVPPVHAYGAVLLVTDSTIHAALRMEIDRLINDMEMDGWIVRSRVIGTDVSVDSLRNLIIQEYVRVPGQLKSLFLLGHIPVPYSGELAPDGHPDHVGAWPADGYYGDINGTWTDITVNHTGASDPRNDNIPGDGKFDQSILPSDLELQVGRVDFQNLPVYLVDEVTLTRNYLDRDHAFRTRGFVPIDRAVIDDNFGAFSGEAFASGGYRNFAPLVGIDSIFAGDYQTELSQKSYLLSYGCGGGSYTSCGGVGTSAEFATDSLQTIFTMLFGSYFGDWDRQNNLMRTTLAQGTTLGIAWSGRPHWMIHPMGLGANIGYCTRLTQNNTTLYSGNYGMHFVHPAYLGDPTLRLHYPVMATDLKAEVLEDQHVIITWLPEGNNEGYFVYRRTDAAQEFSLLTVEPVQTTTYTDSCVLDAGLYEYAVRPVVLQHTPSGTYQNLGTGVRDTARILSDHHVIAGFILGQVGDSVYVQANTTIGATDYTWDFGDGFTASGAEPTHVYAEPGNYTVTLIALSTCDVDTATAQVDILAKTDALAKPQVLVFPSPASHDFTIDLESHLPFTAVLCSADGRKVIQTRSDGGPLQVEVSTLPAGVYTLMINTSDQVFTHCVIVQ